MVERRFLVEGGEGGGGEEAKEVEVVPFLSLSFSFFSLSQGGDVYRGVGMGGGSSLGLVVTIFAEK